MGKTNQCCIEDDEILAEEVRQYPCLYDKSSSDYKDTRRKNNARAKIDEKRKKEVGSSRHDWEVLLSRFSRKRMRYNSLNVSGAGRNKIVQAEKSLEEYRFVMPHSFGKKNPKVIFLRCQLQQKILNLNYLKTRKTVQEVNTRKTAKKNTLLLKKPILRRKSRAQMMLKNSRVVAEANEWLISMC